jgi:hypothetical protein
MKLPRSIRDKSGKTLRTSQEARRYVLAKLEERRGYQSWRHAAELLVHGGSPQQLTTQIEYALLLDGQLDFAFARQQTA